jgi:hypothetical protein
MPDKIAILNCCLLRTRTIFRQAIAADKYYQTLFVGLHPNETLALLHAVLPEIVTAWPYGIENTIVRIGEADGALHGIVRVILSLV